MTEKESAKIKSAIDNARRDYRENAREFNRMMVHHQSHMFYRGESIPDANELLDLIVRIQSSPDIEPDDKLSYLRCAIYAYMSCHENLEIAVRLADFT